MATKKHKLRFELPEETAAGSNATPRPSGWVYRSTEGAPGKRVAAAPEDGLMEIGAKAIGYQAAAVMQAMLFGARLMRLPMDVVQKMAE